VKSGILIAAFALFSSAAGCERPRAREVIAPDGTTALHVQCEDDVGECYSAAGRYCPSGYVMEPSVAGAESGSFLVRCRAPWMVLAPLPAPPPSASPPAWNAPATAEWPPLQGAGQAPVQGAQPVPRVHTPTGPDDPGY
jgi:hypothetical protein